MRGGMPGTNARCTLDIREPPVLPEHWIYGMLPVLSVTLRAFIEREPDHNDSGKVSDSRCRPVMFMIRHEQCR